MRIRLAIFGVALGVVAVGCASGSSFPNARPPTTTTTTEAPEIGVEIVRISNGSFQPANLTIDLNEITFVRVVHDDNPEVIYTILSSGDVFEQFELGAGDEVDLDFGAFEPALYRFSAVAGFVQLPLSIETRPNL